jgi:hypothetical protein
VGSGGGGSAVTHEVIRNWSRRALFMSPLKIWRVPLCWLSRSHTPKFECLQQQLSGKMRTTRMDARRSSLLKSRSTLLEPHRYRRDICILSQLNNQASTGCDTGGMGAAGEPNGRPVLKFIAALVNTTAQTWTLLKSCHRGVGYLTALLGSLVIHYREDGRIRDSEKWRDKRSPWWG